MGYFRNATSFRTRIPENIGEIVVSGDVVTKTYDNNIEETKLAKINDNGRVWHRMGDLGYLDEKNRLWFCGRRAHRVRAKGGEMYTIPCEAIFNEHPDVYRSALVGVKKGDDTFETPVIIVEPYSRYERDKLVQELHELAKYRENTANFRNRVEEIERTYSRRPALISRMEQAGLR